MCEFQAGLLGHAQGSNTPSQNTWWDCTRKRAITVRLLGVQGPNIVVVLGRMMFGDIVTKVFGLGMPLDIYVLILCLFSNPEVSHFHGTGSLSFDCIVGDADSCGIITMYRCGGHGCPILVR